jgi:hypothetical protein
MTCAGLFIFWMNIQMQKNKDRMKTNVLKKLVSKVSLTPKDVIHIGRGFKLQPQNSRSVIFELYANADEPGPFEALKRLVSEIEKEEPFEELPDEVKPSLSRISRLIEQSTDNVDKNVLLPVTTTLSKYVELKAEYEKTKKQTNRAYVITIISFVIGAVSFYFTLKSPSAADIKRAVEQAVIDRPENASATE